MGLILCPDCGKQHSDQAPLCPQCGRLQADTEAESAPLPSIPEMKLAGVVIGNRYRLDEMIGRGGMAVVYRGTHLQLDKQIAIKIVYRHLASDEEIQQRFRKEAQIQFSLQHPGLVRVLDLIDEPGFLGMAMDWIEGQTLFQWMRQRKEPPTSQDILRIFAPLLEIMGYAHSQHVIHRDIKPGNILLQGPSGQEAPKITDFGIAKVLDESGGIQTQANASLGTPTYMSPEQVEGLRKIDHRADIYSLGVLLFCIAAGRPPFKGATHVETANAHLTEPIPRLRSIYHFADERLDPIIAKAMAKDPDLRYPSCEAFLVDLQLLLSRDSSDEFKTVHNLDFDINDTAREISLQWLNENALAEAVQDDQAEQEQDVLPGETTHKAPPSADDLPQEQEPLASTHPETPALPVILGQEVQLTEEARTIVSDEDNMLERMLQVRIEARQQIDESPLSPAATEEIQETIPPPTLNIRDTRPVSEAKLVAQPPMRAKMQPITKLAPPRSRLPLLLFALLFICLSAGIAIWWFWWR